MSRLVGKETLPELALRRALYKRGVRYRKQYLVNKKPKIRADIAFLRQRVCVFVDGCFWHGCPAHFRAPRSNSPWWIEKIEDNRRRDQRQQSVLEEDGWTVLRFWEHEITPALLDGVCERIESAIHRVSK
jgi:DNA mismatch endonuclease (patch repair protein)